MLTVVQTARRFVEREVRQGFRQGSGDIDAAELERLHERAREALLLVRQSSLGRRRLRPPGSRKRQHVTNASATNAEATKAAAVPTTAQESFQRASPVAEDTVTAREEGNDSVKEESKCVTESSVGQILSDTDESSTKGNVESSGAPERDDLDSGRAENTTGEREGGWGVSSSSHSSFGALFRILYEGKPSASVIGGTAANANDSDDSITLDNTVSVTSDDVTHSPTHLEPPSERKVDNSAPTTAAESEEPAASDARDLAGDHSSSLGLGAAAVRGATSAGRLYPSSRPVEGEAAQLNAAFVDSLRKTSR